MKRTILTLSLALFIFTFLLSQTTKEAVRQAKLELYDCTIHLNELLKSLDSMKTEMQSSFEEKQALLVQEKRKLEKKKTSLEEVDQNNASYQEWLDMLEIKKQLFKQEEILSLKEELLKQERFNFYNRLNQIELDIQITIANEINTRIMTFTENIKSLTNSIRKEN